MSAEGPSKCVLVCVMVKESETEFESIRHNPFPLSFNTVPPVNKTVKKYDLINVKNA